MHGEEPATVESTNEINKAALTPADPNSHSFAHCLMRTRPEPSPGEPLTGAQMLTHDEMKAASIALAEVTKRCKAEMDAAQARFRTALAAHLQAITGEQVAP